MLLEFNLKTRHNSWFPITSAYRKLRVEPSAIERERVESTNASRFCWQRRDTGFSRAKQWQLVVSSARERP